jgi:hypothetical protein
MRLINVTTHAQSLIGGKPFAIIGDLAQILWARKTHTDDLDLAVSGPSFTRAYQRVLNDEAKPDWALPSPPDRALEEDRVFKVCHLLFRGIVVDFITFKRHAFNHAILTDALPIQEFNNVRVINPELLLVTHLLRPTTQAAMAAVELLVARIGPTNTKRVSTEWSGFNFEYAKHWATYVGKLHAYENAVRRARDFIAEQNSE